MVSDHYMQRARPGNHLFIWVMGGRGFVHTENQRLDASAGMLFTFRRGRPHAYGSDPDDPWDILWFHFAGPAGDDVLHGVRQAAHGSPVAPVDVDEQLRERWLELVATFHTPSADGPQLANYLAWGVVGLIRHRIGLRAAGQPTSAWQVTQTVQRYVRDHLDQSLTVDDLARVASISPRQLTRLMRDAIGCAPMAYVIDQRIAQAAAMLRQTPRPIKQVAAAVGYDDEYYFSRLFKRRLGLSPTAYRRQASAQP